MRSKRLHWKLCPTQPTAVVDAIHGSSYSVLETCLQSNRQCPCWLGALQRRLHAGSCRHSSTIRGIISGRVRWIDEEMEIEVGCSYLPPSARSDILRWTVCSLPSSPMRHHFTGFALNFWPVFATSPWRLSLCCIPLALQSASLLAAVA